MTKEELSDARKHLSQSVSDGLKDIELEQICNELHTLAEIYIEHELEK